MSAIPVPGTGIHPPYEVTLDPRNMTPEATMERIELLRFLRSLTTLDNFATSFNEVQAGKIRSMIASLEQFGGNMNPTQVDGRFMRCVSSSDCVLALFAWLFFSSPALFEP